MSDPSELAVTTLYIEPGSPWEDGYIESFNAELSDELLNGKIFDTQLESQVLVEWVRRIYDTIPSTQMAGVSTTGSRNNPAYGFGLRGYALRP